VNVVGSEARVSKVSSGELSIRSSFEEDILLSLDTLCSSEWTTAKVPNVEIVGDPRGWKAGQDIDR